MIFDRAGDGGANVDDEGGSCVSGSDGLLPHPPPGQADCTCDVATPRHDSNAAPPILWKDLISNDLIAHRLGRTSFVEIRLPRPER